MSELGSIIKKYRYYIYQNIGNNDDGSPNPCAYYLGNDECSKTDGCYCRKLAEVRGNIDYIIPSGYRDLTINNVSGHITTKNKIRKMVWPFETTRDIQAKLREYMFGGVELNLLRDRQSCNKFSKLDSRFANGESVVIHGDVVRDKVDGLPAQPLPTGKTMLACLIMKEAIWRRLYKTNRADTYAMVSYQNLKSDLKHKKDEYYNLREVDWLCIDDISLPINTNEFAHQQSVVLFDDFLMTRIDNKLPTILVCDFDATSKDYTSYLGYSFQKLITMKSTWHINTCGGG